MDTNSYISFENNNSENYKNESTETWKILLVDDEKDIHSTLKLLLDNFTFRNKKIEFIDAFSAQEAKEKLTQNKNISLIVLDVVMETNYAGLDLVNYIRTELKNNSIRIILLTGQAGYAPEREVITKYEINDYKTKNELTSEKLYSAIFTSLRSYEAIIEVEKYNAELENMVKNRTIELEISNATKERLISIIAHDLSSPLNSIIGYSEMIVQNFNQFSEDDKKEMISGINASSIQIHKLFENVLTWIKSQSNGFGLTKEKINITEIINDTLLFHQLAIKQKNIKIKFENIEHNLAFADRNMILTIVRNILSNAIKYSFNDSEIVIEIHSDNDFQIISINDFGKGISIEKQNLLFEIHKNKSSLGTNGEKGNGLGLVICNEFIKQNNGKIMIESKENEGTKVEIYLKKVIE